MNIEIAQYEALGKELLRRCFAEEEPEDLHRWLSEQLARLGGGDTNAVLPWLESIDLGEKLVDEYAALAKLPEGERKILRWPWKTWTDLIDPLEEGMLGVITAPDGIGKCLAKGTKVIMFDGTMQVVESLQVGDEVMGPDSKPRKIKALGSGHGPMYWVRQKRGLDYRVNDAHILALLQRDEAGNKHKVEMTVTDVLRKSPGYIQRMLQGYKVGLDFPCRDVQLEPYFLGIWLGDGRSINGQIFTADQEVLDYLSGYAKRMDVEFKYELDRKNGIVYKCIISNGRGGDRKSLQEPGAILGRMGLIGNKHIPHEYIANDEDVRLQLLAGLMDSDGYYSPVSKSYEIVQKHEQLARQIKYLADTLGFRTTITPKKATIKDRNYESVVWTVRIMGDVTRIPVKIDRKKAEPRTINKDWQVCGIEIEPDGNDNYYGFVLDGDGLFLLEDCTVTHNTIYAESLAEYWAQKQQHVVFVHFELNRRLMMLRRTARHTGFTVRQLKSGLLRPSELTEVRRVAEWMRSWQGNISYLHTPGWAMDRTVSELRRLHVEGLCDVVVLDYLEKAGASARQLKMYGGNQFQREADNVEQFKNFAEMTEVPAIMVTQMSKEFKRKSIDNMDRTGIRGAGEKSEKANLVVMINRKRNNDGYSPEVDVLIDKNTMGGTGTFRQVMQPEFFRVGDPYDPIPKNGQHEKKLLEVLP